MKSRTYKVMRFLLAWLFRIIFLVIPHGRKNEPKLSEGPYLLCSNHMSAIDPIMICDVVSRQQPRFMAKKELFGIPLLGRLITALGAFPVDRSGRDAGVLVKAVKMLDEGYSVGVFPQGTRRPGVHPSETTVRAGIGVICEHSRATVLPVFLKTKNFRVRFLRPTHVYVGKPITYDEYTSGGEHAGDRQYIMDYIFGRICELDPEYKKPEDAGQAPESDR